MLGPDPVRLAGEVDQQLINDKPANMRAFLWVSFNIYLRLTQIDKDMKNDFYAPRRVY